MHLCQHLAQTNDPLIEEWINMLLFTEEQVRYIMDNYSIGYIVRVYVNEHGKLPTYEELLKSVGE